jgi:protein O-mannosyl-transferase
MSPQRIKRQLIQGSAAKTISERATTPIHGRLRLFFLPLLLSILVVVSFSPVLQNDFINLDDDAYITENVHIQHGITPESIKWAFTKGYSSNWHPLTWLSHMLDWNMFKNNPRGHHLVNLLLHIVNTILLFLFLNTFTGRMYRSLIVAILFGIHPLHVESVAWAAERKDVLSAFFWILSMWMYCAYSKNRTPVTYFLIGILFACGLMSKPMTITLPFVFLLLDYWPLNAYKNASAFNDKMKVFSRLAIEKIPFFILSLISGIITYHVQRSTGATVTLESTPLNDRFANMIMSYGLYIYKMIVPVNLAVFYPYSIDTTPIWLIMSVCIGLIALSVLVVLHAKKHPYLLSGWLWYLGTLVPVIGIVQVGHQAYADRYTYNTLVGVFIVCVWSFCDLVNGYAGVKRIVQIITVVIIFTLSIVTFQQSRLWENSETLFRHTVKCVPYNYLAYNNLGDALLSQGRTDEAIECFKKALLFKPSYGFAHFNLGFQLYKKGRLQESRMHFENGLKDVPDDPKAYIAIGVIYNQEKKYKEAIRWLMKANELNPTFKDSWKALGYAYVNSGDLKRSFNSYYSATLLGCNEPEVYNAMGELQRGLNRNKESYPYFEKAIQLKPDYVPAYQNYVKALTADGRIKEAEVLLKKIQSIDPYYKFRDSDHYSSGK